VPLPSQAIDGQQVVPLEQVFPHSPQLSGMLGSTHPPWQKMEPEPQHPPFVQASPEAQAAPQAPQLASSWVRSTHAPPHEVWPWGHAQAPPAQTSVAAHAWPQAPQLSGSVWRSTQPQARDGDPSQSSW
jgi:hypothetical protein